MSRCRWATCPRSSVRPSTGQLRGAEIKECELETENGRAQYAIAAVIDGQTFDIEIAPDGTLLQREVEDEDDE